MTVTETVEVTPKLAPEKAPAPTVTVTATETPVVVASQPAMQATTVAGHFNLLYGMSKQVMGKAPTCDAKGADVKIKNGAGDVIALADVPAVKPTDVKPGAGGFTTWTCPFPYTADLVLDSAVYTFEASLSGLPEYGAYEQTLSGDELTSGKGPYLQLTFAPELQ